MLTNWFALRNVHPYFTCYGIKDDGLPKCAENYSPCTCKLDLDYGKVVHCSSSAVSSPEQLKDTFLRLQLSGYIMDLYEFTLNLPSNKENGATIPANMMGRNNRAGIVKITCPSTDYRLKIDPDAFRSSGDRMFYLSISDCNLSQTDWSFLDGFTKMSLLSIANSIIIVPDDLVASLSPDLVPTMTVEVNGKIVRNLFWRYS